MLCLASGNGAVVSREQFRRAGEVNASDETPPVARYGPERVWQVKCQRKYARADATDRCREPTEQSASRDESNSAEKSERRE